MEIWAEPHFWKACFQSSSGKLFYFYYSGDETIWNMTKYTELSMKMDWFQMDHLLQGHMICMQNGPGLIPGNASLKASQV